MASDWSPWNLWWLITDTFISPPTSLWIDPSNAGGDKYALCNLSFSLDVKAGMLKTYHGRAYAGLGQTFIYLGVTGPGATTAKIVIVSPTWDWKYTRITWWQGENPPGTPKTIVERATFTAGDWVADPLMYFPPMSGAVNRVGIGCTPQSLGRVHYFDNTEIWRPC